MEYTAIIKDAGDGWLMGQCEQVPGAITQGRSIKEVKENLKEAITLILEDEMEDFRIAHQNENFISREAVFA